MPGLPSLTRLRARSRLPAERRDGREARLRIRRRAGVCCEVLAVTALLAGVLAAAQPARGVVALCRPGPSQLRDPGTFSNVPLGVAVTSACNAWAVGGHSDGHAHDPLIERWNGARWLVQASARSGTLAAVAALSARYAWAVGGAFHKTLTEQWDGRRWRVVRGGYTRWGAQLTGVAVLSRSDAWAVGYNRVPGGGGATQTLIEHWDGTRWRRVASRDPGFPFNELMAVTAVSPRSAWAVGWASDNSSGSVPLIEHWDGRSWRRVRVRGVGAYSELDGVSAASARDVWAVGRGENARGVGETLTERWNGTTWHRVASPSPGLPGHARLSAVATLSPSRAWAVGSFLNAGGGIQTLIERWNGTAWRQVPSPNPGGRATDNEFTAVSTAPGGLTWAVGDYAPFRPPGSAIRALAARIR
jgi:hypothetical protein